jgi:hypothetical protein
MGPFLKIKRPAFASAFVRLGVKADPSGVFILMMPRSLESKFYAQFMPG